MEPMTAFLMSMQAAGLVTSVYSAGRRSEMIQIGRTLQKEELDTNLKALRLQFSESSLEAMKKLRADMGSQIAINAAKGRRGGSSQASINRSFSNFQQDERARRINLLARESSLRASNILSGLHTAESESELGRSLTKSLFDTVRTSSLMPKSKDSNSDSGSFWGFE